MPLSPQQSLNEAAAGDLEGVRKAISEGADPKNNGSSALQFAAEQGHTECVRELIPLSNPLADNSWALQRAASNGHTECVRLLIPVSDPKSNNSEPLLRAAIRGQADCVRLLIPVSDPKAQHSRALQFSVSGGNIECALLLIPFSDIDAAKTCLADGGLPEKAKMLEAIVQETELKKKHVSTTATNTRNSL